MGIVQRAGGGGRREKALGSELPPSTPLPTPAYLTPARCLPAYHQPTTQTTHASSNRPAAATTTATATSTTPSRSAWAPAARPSASLPRTPRAPCGRTLWSGPRSTRSSLTSASRALRPCSSTRRTSGCCGDKVVWGGAVLPLRCPSMPDFVCTCVCACVHAGYSRALGGSGMICTLQPRYSSKKRRACRPPPGAAPLTPLPPPPLPPVPLRYCCAARYLLALDGQGLSSRLEQLLPLGSLVLKEESGYYGRAHTHT